ncbi:aldo-keto reductase [Aureococcus anophagefferens]|uniref:Aldo-keto reductase n=1 Tax=Aureococcus anophagefferens TaxID=44056 RepID=A0ABR1GAS1_AURAN
MWTKLFELMDADGSGRLRFAELLEAVRKLGLGEQHLAERDVLGLWTHADADASGELSADEFQDAVYRLEVEAWLNLDTVEGEARLRQIVSVLDAAAEKWHRASGNWYKIFRMFDADDSGHMQFEELEHVLRDGYPGFGLGEKQVSTPHLQGMWRSLDADRSGQVSVQEFMATARPKHVELPVDRLHGVCKLIDKALVADFRRRGVHSSIAGNVKRLFREIDEDGSDRVTLAELEGAVRIRLRLGEGQAGGNWFKIFKRLDTSGDGLMGFEEIEHIIRAIFPGLHITKKELSEENARGLWKALDADRSGAISVQEFMIFMRRHGMHHETIPYIATKQQKDRLAPEMSLDRLDIKFGFGLGKLRVLADKSKALPKRGPDINEWGFCGLLRDTLAIDEAALSDDDIHTIWRAIDTDAAGAIAPPARRDESGGDAASESVELVERAKSAAVLGRDLEADAAAALVETATGYIPPWAWRFRRLALEALGGDPEHVLHRMLLDVLAIFASFVAAGVVVFHATGAGSGDRRWRPGYCLYRFARRPAPRPRGRPTAAAPRRFHQHRLRRWLGAADGRDARAAKVFTILYCVYGNAIVVSALQLLRAPRRSASSGARTSPRTAATACSCS